VHRDTGEHSCNHSLSGKVLSAIYSECVFVDLGLQHTRRVCCVILLSVTCLSTLSHTPHDFRGGIIVLCFHFLYDFSLKRFLFREELNETWAKVILVGTWSVGYCCQMLMKLKLARKIFWFFPLPNATTCPYRLRGPPSWLWPKCNRLLRLGRTWGAVMLSRWGGWWYVHCFFFF
jgi:hypothetical protein